jgi:glycosyltransferase involved in cell wall biosynthesis
MAARRRTHVVTFASRDFEGSACYLRHSALHVGGADAVHVFGERDVAGFFDRHPHLLAGRGRERGHGWWAWKPHLIGRVLDRVPDGDVVVWVDAAARFVGSVARYVDAMDLVDAARGKDVVLFRLGGWLTTDHAIGSWTKPRALDALATELGVDRDVAARRSQVNAGVQVYRASAASRAFVARYADLCTRLDVVADPGSDPAAPDEPRAREDHRHDQSVLSVLALAHGVDVSEWRDPTQYGVDDPEAPGTPASLPPLLDHHRARVPLPPKVAVVTATTGGPHLRACVASVQAQTYPNLEHWVVQDGPCDDGPANIDAVVAEFAHRAPIVRFVLPRATGRDGWNGHRIYAALSFLVDAPLISFLDDDNEAEPDHVAAMAQALARDPTAAWAYSLRVILDRDEDSPDDAPTYKVVCRDTCESLGALGPTCLGPRDRLVDTSCYLLPTDLARDAAACWNARARDVGRPEVDRALAAALLGVGAGACSRRHSLRYRVGSSGISVRADFFVKNNDPAYDFERKPDVYVFHFGPRQTAEYFAKRAARARAGEPVSHAYDEWQMTLWRGLDTTHNVLDGFANVQMIPRGATCLAVMCHPQELPLDLFAERTDLLRVCYTLESPNIRHQAQWDAAFLARHFDHVLTYWRPLLADFRVQATWCPHNTHHLDLADPADRAQLRDNEGTDRSAVMVLERRPLAGTFHVNGVRLTCLDGLRETYVDGLRDATVYGQGWDTSDLVTSGRATLGHALHRSVDPLPNVDILKKYVFNVIVENVDADGYASEKLYDALVAGCVPLYYGSAPPFVPRDMYVDLKAFADGRAVQAFLDALSDEDVARMRRRVAEGREAVLQHVSCQAFADTVRAVIDPQPEPPRKAAEKAL